MNLGTVSEATDSFTWSGINWRMPASRTRVRRKSMGTAKAVDNISQGGDDRQEKLTLEDKTCPR